MNYILALMCEGLNIVNKQKHGVSMQVILIQVVSGHFLNNVGIMIK